MRIEDYIEIKDEIKTLSLIREKFINVFDSYLNSEPWENGIQGAIEIAKTLIKVDKQLNDKRKILNKIINKNRKLKNNG